MTAQIVECERAVVRLRRERADADFDLGERQPVSAVQHRDDQAFRRTHGDTDVIEMFEHHLVALDLGVETREFAERDHDGFDEERRDAETDAVLLFERLLLPLAERHHGAHVRLVERRQHGGGVLRLLKPPGDGLAQAT